MLTTSHHQCLQNNDRALQGFVSPVFVIVGPGAGVALPVAFWTMLGGARGARLEVTAAAVVLGAADVTEAAVGAGAGAAAVGTGAAVVAAAVGAGTALVTGRAVALSVGAVVVVTGTVWVACVVAGAAVLVVTAAAEVLGTLVVLGTEVAGALEVLGAAEGTIWLAGAGAGAWQLRKVLGCRITAWAPGAAFQNPCCFWGATEFQSQGKHFAGHAAAHGGLPPAGGAGSLHQCSTAPTWSSRVAEAHRAQSSGAAAAQGCCNVLGVGGQDLGHRVGVLGALCFDVERDSSSLAGADACRRQGRRRRGGCPC